MGRRCAEPPDAPEVLTRGRGWSEILVFLRRHDMAAQGERPRPASPPQHLLLAEAVPPAEPQSRVGHEQGGDGREHGRRGGGDTSREEAMAEAASRRGEEVGPAGWRGEEDHLGRVTP